MPSTRSIRVAESSGDATESWSAEAPVRDLPSWIGPYRVLGLLGEGGMAQVYRARDEVLDRMVAVKVMRCDLRRPGVATKRFQREARVLAGISDPHVVEVRDLGEFEGRPYLVMDLVEGDTLADLLREGPLALEEALPIVEKIARGVQAIHDAGVIHRDLKPGNVLIGSDGEPRILDLGLARRVDGASSVTASKAVVGTPRYLAPEQILGERGPVGPLVDVHALGAILYEAITGCTPFVAESLGELYAEILFSDPTPPSSVWPATPPEVERIVLRALQKDPALRHPSAAAFADDLRRLLEEAPAPTPRARRRTAGLALAAGLGLALLAAVVTEPGAPPPDMDSSGDRLAAGRLLVEDALRTSDPLDRRNLATRAIPLLERALRDDPSSAVRGLLAAAWRAAGDLDRTEAVLREAGTNGLPLARVLLEQAVARLLWPNAPTVASRRNVEGAERRAIESIRLLEGDRSAGAPDWLAVAYATNALARRDPEAVVAVVDDARSRPCDPEAIAWLEVLLALARPEGQDEAIARALALRPDGAPALVLCATRRMARGDPAGARADLDQAIRADPRLGAAYFVRGLLRDQGNDREGAIEDFSAAAGLCGDLAAPWFQSAVSRLAQGDSAGGLADLDRALVIAPDLPDAWYWRSLARGRQGDLGGAAADAEVLIERWPELWGGWFLRGNLLALRGERAGAIEDLSRALSRAPPGWIEHGRTLALLHDLDPAGGGPTGESGASR